MCHGKRHTTGIHQTGKTGKMGTKNFTYACDTKY